MTTYEILKKLNKNDKLSLLLKLPLIEILSITKESNRITNDQLKDIVVKILNECN